MTNAELKARELALEILKAYHREIKSVHAADTSAVERTKGQAEVFKVAEKFILEIGDEASGYIDSVYYREYLNRKAYEP